MFDRKFLLVLVMIFVTMVATASGQTLIVEARPLFSETEFVQNNGHDYLLAEIQNIRTGGTQFDRVTSDNVQYQDFYFIHPDGYLECQIEVKTSGHYNIFTYLVQHGNSGPRARVYVDGTFRNEITGGAQWSKTSVYLNAGKRTIRYEESGSGSTEWPLRLVGFDAVAVTNDPEWTPPAELATHPYTGNQHWWQRPSEQLSQIEVSIGDKTAIYEGAWNYTDILLLDHTGEAQGTARNFSIFGDSLAGKDLDQASVSSNTVKRIHQSALVTSSTKNRIKPNYDMIADEVEINIPKGQSGYVSIKRYDDSKIRQMPGGQYVWDGRVGNDIYSNFAQQGGYLLEFIPTSNSTVPLLACVYSNPKAPSRARPRVLEISPNGDDVYDIAEVYVNIDYNASDAVVVRDSNGSVVRNLPKENPIVWDGKNADGDVCEEGQYSIEILDSTGQLRAGSRINVLDLPPTGKEPHDPGDFFVLGMWLGFDSTSSADLDDIVAMNCNAIRHPHSGTVKSGSMRSPESWWSAAESRDLKVLVNLAEIVHPILEMPMAPSEPHLEILLAPYVDPIKNKSALLGYELIDEPQYKTEWGYRLRAIQQVLHRLDPTRPSVPVLIGYDERISGYTSDLQPHQLLLDIYPCNQGTQPGDFRNIWGYNLEMMEYIDWAMAFVEPRGVPTWIIHQGHEFLDDLREPIPEEIAMQVWLGLTRAITGSFFFIYETQQCWTGIKDNPSLKAAVTEIYGRLSHPEVYEILPHLQRDNFDVSITGGGNPYGYSSGEAKPLTDVTKKYIIAVNRNATSTSDITLDSTDYPNAALKDMETGQEHQMGEEIHFSPGDGRIFRVLKEQLQPPEAPQGVSTSNVTETMMRLSWVAPGGNTGITGYHIYDGHDDSLLKSTTSTYYEFSNLTPDQKYCFYVTAYNSMGQSPESETVCQMTFPAEPPTMPDNVKVTHYAASQIQIQWDSASDNVAVLNYDVFLNGNLYDTVTSTSYHFTELQPETRYDFQVQARDVDGNLSLLTPAICAVTCQSDGIPIELEGHWRFDENAGVTAHDSSSYGRDGIINNASWTTGYHDKALEFDGEASSVEIEAFEVIGNQFTIAAWVKADSFNFSGDNRIMSKAEGSAETDHFWMLSTRRGGGADHFFRFRLKTNGTTHTLQGSSQTINTGQWVHVCATYDGSMMRIYVNGIQDSATLAVYGHIENDENVNVLIGSNPGNISVWDGVIDDVRIYSAALSGNQIQEVMEGNEPLPPGPSEESCNRLVDFNCDGIVDFYDFSYIAKSWGQDAFPGLGNVTEDGVVDLQDLEIFISEWLILDTWAGDEAND